MRAYELMVIFDSGLDDLVIDDQVKSVTAQIATRGGTVASTDRWGRRRLAYEIDHKPEGVYHLLSFTAEPAALDEVSRVLRITDGVLRHLATRRPKRGPGQPVAAGGPAREDVADTIEPPSGEEE